MATDTTYQLSVLDLSPVSSGSTSSAALRNTLDLARLADDLGFHRYWLAEHHNTRLIASSVPAIMIGHVADVTSRIRVGSGGVMLPNHAPLAVAESFRMLEALHPGRIDLGIGRAPGTDSRTAFALRRRREVPGVDEFPAQLDDLLAFLSDGFPDDHPFARVHAIPDDVPAPPIFLLGSSDYSAQYAGRRGLGFVFAHHIDPLHALVAFHMYRRDFRPSPFLAEPQALLAVSVVCAETDERAAQLAAPLELRLLRFQQGNYGPLASEKEAAEYPYSDPEREAMRMNRSRFFAGSPSTVREQLTALADQVGAREIIITTMVHAHEDRRRSYELLAEAFSLSAPRGCPTLRL